MANKTVYCPSCLKYGMKSADQGDEQNNAPTCPLCGGQAQWEDEVLIPVSPNP